ncbi:MAG: hypothetical protein WD059_06750 [Balneolaceae bacterium]
MKYALILSLTFLLLTGCFADKEPGLSVLNNPASDNSSLPRLFTDNTGTVFLSWVEEDQNVAMLKYSSFDDDSWSQPQTVASNSGWFVNWADFPSIIAKDGKPIAAHWLDKIPGNSYSYNVAISRFNGSWSDPQIPHDDSTATEHGFVSMIPDTDSTFAAIWLDGRNTAGREHHEYSDAGKAMTLRGAFIDQNSGIIESFEIDSNVCDCCNTAIAKTENGLIAAYRNRTEDEIRDIYITRYTNGAWLEPKAVADDNWEIAACPVNGPAIDAEQKNIAVAWFTGAEGKARVKLSISSDNGESFSEPVIVDEEGPLGRVDLDIDQDKIWMSWIATIDNETNIQVRSYDFSGNKLATFSIPEFSKNRSSGFPQITPHKDGLIVAYTDISGDNPSIKTAVLK